MTERERQEQEIATIREADDPKKVNWLVLRNAYYVIDRIKELKKGERK